MPLKLAKATALASILSVNLLHSNISQALTIDTDALFMAKLQPQIAVPSHYKIYPVNTVKQVYLALSKIHQQGGYAAILFADGTYHLKHTLNISAPHTMLLSQSANPAKVILSGNGMKPTNGVDNLIRVSGSHFVIDGLTLEQAGNHLIQIAGENGAKRPIIRNSILRDGYEQLVKVTYSRKNSDKFSNDGLVENCLFRYTDEVGPNYYIGGIDAHGIKNWLIRDNIFESIASPSNRIAEHAIHLWNDTADNTVQDNWIINSDRGIGFGMRQKKKGYNSYSNFSGVIKGNIIYHGDNEHLSADTGIILEDSADTLVENNIILLKHNYPNAIEFRFPETKDVLIRNNVTNRKIRNRNGAQGVLINNRVEKSLAIEQAINKRMGSVLSQ